MRTDPRLCSLLIRIVAVIEYHHLHIAKNVFHWIIIWACFGQADPVQFQLSHRVPSDSRFARVRTVLIQSEPHVFGFIPTMHLLHKMAYVFGTLAIQVFLSHLPHAFIVEQEQIELPASLLTKRQHQALFARVAASTVGFDEDKFDTRLGRLVILQADRPYAYQAGINTSSISSQDLPSAKYRLHSSSRARNASR